MDKQFFKGLGIGLISSIILAVLNLILTPIVINKLGLLNYGIFSIYTNWLMIISILDVAISRTTSREISNYLGAEKPSYKIKLLLQNSEFFYYLMLLSILLVFISFFLIFKSLGLSGFYQNTFLYLLIVFSGFFQLLSNFYFTCLIGFQHQEISSYLNGIIGTFRILTLITMLIFFIKSIETFFLVYFVFFLFQALVFRFVIKKASKIPIKFKLHKNIFFPIFKKSIVMIGIGATGILMSYSDKIILSFILSLDKFAIYNLAWIIASSLFLITMPFSQGIEVKISKIIGSEKKDELYKIFSESTFILFSLLITSCYFISQYSYDLINLWLDISSDVEIISKLTNIMIIGSLFVSASYPLTSIVLCLNQSKLVLKINVIILIIYMPIMIIVTNGYKMLGASYLWMIYGLSIFIITITCVYHLEKNKQIFSIVFVNLIIPFLICIFIDQGTDFLNLHILKLNHFLIEFLSKSLLALSFLYIWFNLFLQKLELD